MNVFVKEDLVEPKMEDKTTPGAKVKVIGILKEVPVPLSTGGLSTRFELAVEANNIIEDFMLAANRCAAHFLSTKEDKLPGVYRIHDKPSIEKMNDFFSK